MRPAAGAAGSKPLCKRLPAPSSAGVDSGFQLRVEGKGGPGPKGAPPGDLYIFGILTLFYAALGLGLNALNDMRRGAAEMDDHFLNMKENIEIIELDSVSD